MINSIDFVSQYGANCRPISMTLFLNTIGFAAVPFSCNQTFK